MMFIVGAVALGLGFFDIEFSPTFKQTQRTYVPVVAIALVLLAVAVGLWLLDREKKIAAETYLDGHYRLIMYLVCFVEAHDHRPAEHFANVLSEERDDPRLAARTARYVAIVSLSTGFSQGKCRRK